MAKDTEKYKQFEIEWVTLPSIPWGNHGVELHYKGERGILIGFIEGYEWHHKNSGFCKVITLSEDSSDWVNFNLRSIKILSELKSGFTGSPVSWPNQRRYFRMAKP